MKKGGGREAGTREQERAAGRKRGEEVNGEVEKSATQGRERRRRKVCRQQEKGQVELSQGVPRRDAETAPRDLSHLVLLRGFASLAKLLGQLFRESVPGRQTPAGSPRSPPLWVG